MSSDKKNISTDTRVDKLNLRSDAIEGYCLLGPDDNETSNPEPIGEGGSGVVYKAKQKLYGNSYANRAVKFFIYKDEILNENPEKQLSSENEFLNEIANIVKFNHQNLIQVINAGDYQYNGTKIPYLVTDFIDGTTLKDILGAQKSLDEEIRQKFIDEPDRVLDYLLDIAAAIKHIHDHGYAHCDIAPKNIFVYKNGDQIIPILGDLALAKPMKFADGQSKVKIIGSRSWMPPSAEKHLNKTVDYKLFSKLQPYWDIYSFARTATKLLEIFEENKPRSWFDPLISAFDDAKDESKRCTINDLIERLEFLKPIHREIAQVQELSIGVGVGYQKMMPVEALTTTKRLHRLIRHPAIWRLSHVPQITTSNQTMPRASHTRYEHSLGVTETMRRYLLSLRDESEFLKHLSVKKIEVALVAAALSSGSRFPLSNIVHEIKNKDELLFENFSRKSLYEKLLKCKNNLSETLENFVEKEYPNIEIKNLLSILCGEEEKFGHDDKLIHSLLNNSLDVRVIDFVRRDAHHLGIISGDSFKIDELLPHVTIHDHKLALKITGMSVAEQIILLRYWLFSRVYWNRPNRIYCAMVRTILLALHDCDGFLEKMYSRVFQFDQRGIVEFLIEQATVNNLPEIEDLAKRLGSEKHSLFKIIFETSEMDKKLGEQFKKLKSLNIQQLKEITEYLWERLSRENAIKKPPNKIPVIVDYPIEPNNTKLGSDVNVRIAENKFRPMHEVSGVIKGVNESFEKQLSRFNVFIHPDLAPEKEKRNIYDKQISLYVTQYLDTVVGD